MEANKQTIAELESSMARPAFTTDSDDDLPETLDAAEVASARFFGKALKRQNNAPAADMLARVHADFASDGTVALLARSDTPEPTLEDTVAKFDELEEAEEEDAVASSADSDASGISDMWLLD